MTAAVEPKTKPPFLRRRWPYFVLGFLLALPAPNLAWRVIEHRLYGDATIPVTLVEIDPPSDPYRLVDIAIGHTRPEYRSANDQARLTRSVRAASPNVDVEIRYVDRVSGNVRSAKSTVPLDRGRSGCFVVIRHRPEGIDISPCMRVVPTL